MGSTKYPLIAPPGGGAPHLPQPGQPAPMRPDEFYPGSIANVTTFNFKQVEPPSPLYVQRDDILFVTATAELTANTVRFIARFLRVPEPTGGQPSEGGVGRSPGGVFEHGVVETIVKDLVPAGSGQTISAAIQMAEGYLLSIAAANTPNVTRGQVFARAMLTRGAGIFGTMALPLFGDYVTGFAGAGWPGGRNLSPVESNGWITSLQVANPAAGADWTLLVSNFERMRVSSFSAQFVASATVANRVINIIVDDGANIVWQDDVVVNVTAGQTVSVNGTGTQASTGIIATELFVVLPPGLILPVNWRIRSSTGAIQAGDQWSNIWFNVERWVDNGA